MENSPSSPAEKPEIRLRTVVFIDGQNMYKGAREAFDYEHEKGHYGNFRPLGLARLLTQEPHRDLTQVRFYQGMPHPDHDRMGHAIAQRRVEAWRNEDPELVRVFTRTLRYPPREGREKGVDVQIAIDLVALAFDNEYDLAVLCSADTDLLPAVTFVVQRYHLKMVECVAWDPVPGREANTAAPLDARGGGVIRRTVPKEDFDKIADRTNYMLIGSAARPAPGQSGRQLPTRRRQEKDGS